MYVECQRREERGADYKPFGLPAAHEGYALDANGEEGANRNGREQTQN